MILEGLHEKEIFSGDYPFRLVESCGELSYPPHWHNAIELVYTLEGMGGVNVDGMDFLLEKGEILIIPAGAIHDVHTWTGKSKRAFIQFNLSMHYSMRDICDLTPFLTQPKKISPEADGGFHQAVERQIVEIISAHEKREFAYALFINARLYDILVILSRNLAVKKDLNTGGRGAKKTAGLEKINGAFKYIEENYQRDITLKETARTIGFSEYYFSRLFKEITEKNFHCYLNEFRIKKAEKLLMDNSLTVSQVAHEAGFNSFVTFNRIFKRVKGCSPTFYKKARI